MNLPMDVGVAELKTQISARIFGEEFSEVSRVARLDGSVARGSVELAERVLNESGRAREPRRNPRRVRNHPYGVLQQVISNHRKLVRPQKVARCFGHRGNLSLAREIEDDSRVRLERLVGQILRDVTDYPRRIVRTRLSVRNLDVRKLYGRRMTRRARRSVVDRSKIFLGQVAEVTVRRDFEIVEGHGLEAVDRERRHEKHDLARERAAALDVEVRGLAVREPEELLQVAPIHSEPVAQPRRKGVLDAPHVTRGL